MLLKDFKPADDVAAFVQLYRIVHLRFDKEQPIPFKAYPPRPEHCLAFYPYDTETVEYKNSGKTVTDLPVVLYGQFTEVTNRLIGNNFLVFQIIFHPGALYQLSGVPANELTNAYIDATAVFSNELHLTNEQLYHAKDYGEMIHIANELVRKMIQKQRKSRLLIDDALQYFLQLNGMLAIDRLAKSACLSAKQLDRKCVERLGVNPKLYSKIIRFDKVFRLKNSHPNLDWLRLALECDFHDYQHLSKEYKYFTQLTPTAFHEIENNAPERKLGLSEGYYQ
ncbi:MAG: helix-turn-helix domain-containing protein [Ferruginibacter sp.]